MDPSFRFRKSDKKKNTLAHHQGVLFCLKQIVVFRVD